MGTDCITLPTACQAAVVDALTDDADTAAALAEVVAAVIGIAALMEPSAPETAPLSIATLNIDDVLVEEAGLALGQENLVDALCVLSSTETGVISSDNIQDLLL